jgi:hypothetical protein
MRVEAERLRTKRRLIAALADASADDSAHGDAEALTGRYRQLEVLMDRLRPLLHDLREHLSASLPAPSRPQSD